MNKIGNAVLIGESGSGKSTIEKVLVDEFGFKKVISYTTRSPRPGEENGVDYNFISNKQFDELLRLNKFAEYDEYAGGERYGSLKSDYDDLNGRGSVAVLTPLGAKKLKQSGINFLTCYVYAPLGIRALRYLGRLDSDDVKVSDIQKLYARAERDSVMFMDAENESDIKVINTDGCSTLDCAKKIVDKFDMENDE